MKGGYQLIDCHGANLHENGITIDGIFKAIDRNHGKNIILTNFILLGVLCADTAIECQFSGSVYSIPYFFGKKIVINASDVLTVSDLGYVNESQMESAIENAVDGLMENPMTEEGDIIYGGEDGVPSSLERGTAGQVLTLDPDTLLPKWETPQVGGGTKLYLHTIELTVTYTILGNEFSSVTGTFFQVLTNFNKNYSEMTAQEKYDFWEGFTGINIETGSAIYLPWATVQITNQGGITGTRYSPKNLFSISRRVYPFMSYPGGSLTIQCYDSDAIDLSTGNLKDRVNMLSDVSVTNIVDTVTEL